MLASVIKRVDPEMVLSEIKNKVMLNKSVQTSINELKPKFSER